MGACACAVWVYNIRSIRLTTEDPQNHFLSSDVLQIRISCYITYMYSNIADRRCLEIGLYQASVLVLKGVYCTYTHILLLYMPADVVPVHTYLGGGGTPGLTLKHSPGDVDETAT